jgi:predicted DCC family thiol-disulfide oxidoreductase YuxK
METKRIAKAGDTRDDVWLVYDGKCPICTTASHALQIRKAVGNLCLLDARVEGDHPLMQEIKAKQLSLDEGMVIKFQNVCYHGADALHVMALLGTEHGWFNRMNAWLFRSKTLAKHIYPFMRAMRNLVINLKGISKIDNLRNK